MLEVESIGARIVADATQYVQTMTQTVPTAARNAVNQVMAQTQQLRIASSLVLAEAAATSAAVIAAAGTASTTLTVSAASATAAAIGHITSTVSQAAPQLLRITHAGMGANDVFQRITQSANAAAAAIAAMRTASSGGIGGPPKPNASTFHVQPTPLRITHSPSLPRSLPLGSSWANAPSASIMRQLSFAASNLSTKLMGVATAAAETATYLVRLIPGGNAALALLGQIGLTAGPAAVAVLAVGTALAGLALGTWAVGLAADVQSAETRFRVLYGSAEKAKTLVSSIRTLADTTPLETQPLLDSAAALAAANVAAEDITGTLRMLGDLAAGNQNKLQFLSKAYTDVKNKGKLQGQELRQFAENGVGLLPVLAMMKFGDATTANIRKVQELSEAGEISFYEAQKALRTLTDEGGRFHGMMDMAAKDMHGRWSTMKDTWKRAGAEMGTTLLPVAEALTEELLAAGTAAVNIVEKLKYTWGYVFGEGEESSPLQNTLQRITKDLDNLKNMKPDDIKVLQWLEDQNDFDPELIDQMPEKLKKHLAEIKKLKETEHNQPNIKLNFKLLFGDEEHDKLMKKKSGVALRLIEEARRIQEDEAAKTEADQVASNEKQIKLDEETKSRKESVAKSIEEAFQKSQQAIEALNNGWSDEMARDMAVLDELRKKGGPDDNGEALRALAAQLAHERELTAAVKERGELEKEVADASKTITAEIFKAQQEVRALSEGWSDEVARDFAILENLATKFGLESNDPRLQQLAQLMDKEHALTAMAKERAEADKEQKAAAKAAQEEMTSDAKAIHEKFMDPLEKLRIERGKLFQLRKLNLIDDRELKMALEDLKEIERQRDAMNIDFGLSAEQIQLMAGATRPSSPQGLVGAGPVDSPMYSQQGSNAAKAANQEPLANIAPEGQNAGQASEQNVATAIMRMSDDIRRMYWLERDASEREEVVEVVEIV